MYASLVFGVFFGLVEDRPAAKPSSGVLWEIVRSGAVRGARLLLVKSEWQTL